METTKDSYMREYRNVTVRTIDGGTIRGKINIGLKERVSDLFTRSDTQFIVLSEVKARDVVGNVLILNKNNIVWVEPED